MARRSALQIAFHGILMVVLGMLVGLPFADAITSHSGPKSSEPGGLPMLPLLPPVPCTLPSRRSLTT